MERCRLFNQCWNLPVGHCVSRVQAFLIGSEPTSLALLSRGAGCLSGVSFYLLSRLDGQNFYFRTDPVKPGHMQLLLLRSAFFFLLREIYSVRMSTSEFGSIILLNKESLHLISVDPI